MRLILLGAPGAGKGTQAEYLSQHFSVPIISTGSMLRKEIAARTPLGLQAQSLLDAGSLVPDGVVMNMVLSRLIAEECAHGFILDGFPRTIPQAEGLQQSAKGVQFVVEIAVADALIVRRISGRRVHETSGRSYHVDFNPPTTPNVDDLTGEPLVQRADDKEETVQKRLDVYHAQTKPLVAYYKEHYESDAMSNPKYCVVDGSGDVKEVRKAVLACLSS